MDFDEYEYLEKTVENPEAIKDTSGLEDNGRAVPAGGQDDKERIRRSNRRSDEDGHSVQHGSKRARSEEDSRERERERERSERTADQRHGRGSSHRGYPPQYRSRNLDTVEKIRYKSSRERDTDHDRERTDRNGMYKDREKTKRDGDRDRDNLRDRDCESKREVDRERSRRSRGLSERRCTSEHHCTDKESNPEREQDSGDRELKERERKLNERERERELREKDDRCFKERKEEAPEAEADPERDQRTVFAYQICLKANEKDVYEFFSRAGKVRDVQLIMDRNSRRSKGVGYIEFYDAMSVPMAIALSGQLLHGQPVMIKPSEAEKNLVQSNAAVAGGPGGFIGPNSGGARRLYVGNLHFNITEDQLRQVFEPFGTVELVQLPTVPETGQCKGFGFVQFMRLEDARAAQSLNGQLEIAGRIIKVSALSDQAGMQDLGANAGDFDDDDGGGISLNARSRAILMQKLDRSTATSVAGSVATTSLANPSLSLPKSAVPGVFPVAAPIAPTLGSAAIPGYMGLQSSMLAPPAVAPLAVDIIGVPSDCLLLKNMFDPKNETESDFDVDIKEDVHDECSKFGTVKHIFVDKYSAGHVYLCFDSVTSAVGAQCALHGRWFAGKMITAIYMPSSSYWEKFSDSK